MKESMQRWKAERDNNADYIAKLKQNKEERKKEIEAQEALLLQMKEEEEAAEEKVGAVARLGEQKKQCLRASRRRAVAGPRLPCRWSQSQWDWLEEPRCNEDAMHSPKDGA